MAELHLVAEEDSRTVLPPSGLEHVDRLLDQLHDALRTILDVSSVRFDDANANSSGVWFVGRNEWQWGDLPDEAAPRVGRAREALRHLREFTANAARHAPDRKQELEQLDDQLERIIEQPNGTYPRGAPESTIEKIGGSVAADVDEYRRVISRLPSAHGDGERLLIVDTSALLDRPDLQNWLLDGAAWTVILLPQVLSELDDRKRDDRTREAATKVINQIEEFDRRGDTFTGVSLAGKLSVREVPISPPT